jgi:uridine kinase
VLSQIVTTPRRVVPFQARPAAPAVSAPPDGVSLSFQPLDAPGKLAVAALDKAPSPAQTHDVCEQLRSQLKAWPSLWATVAMAPDGAGNTTLLVASRDDAISQSSPEGVYGLIARLCSTPAMRTAATAAHASYAPASAVPDEASIVSLRLPGSQTPATLAAALQNSGQPNQKDQLQRFIADLPQGTRVAVPLGGPSGAGKTTLTDDLRKLAAPRKVVVLTGDMYFRDVDDPDYPMTDDGTYYFDSPKAMHMDEMAGDIAKLIKTGHADIPQYDFAGTRPGGWHRPVNGVTGVRLDTKTPVDLGPDDILVIDSLHATNPTVIGLLDKLDLPHRSLYLDSQRSEDRLLRRIVRDFEQREGSAERTLAFWDKTTFPGEVFFVRPTLTELDPAQDLYYVTKFPTDLGLSREQINHKVDVLGQYGLPPTYPAFATADENMPAFAKSEKARLEAIVASTTATDAQRAAAQRNLERMRQAPHPTP